MFAIPQLMAVPAMTGVGAMAMDWPTVGAFLAWTLIAAFVGTGLGALRRMTSPPPRLSQPLPTHAVLTHPSIHVDRKHLKAA